MSQEAVTSRKALHDACTVESVSSPVTVDIRLESWTATEIKEALGRDNFTCVLFDSLHWKSFTGCSRDSKPNIRILAALK